MLILAAAVAKGRDPRVSEQGVFLLLASAAGLVVMALLVLPVAAAQDWDLASMLLLPTGILGVWVGAPLFDSGKPAVRVALVTTGLGCLLAFVLVNASVTSGTRRYDALLQPGARVTDFARQYGYASLAQFHRQNGRTQLGLTYVSYLIKAAPSNPRYWGMGGEFLVHLGRNAEAIHFLRESIRLEPNRAAPRTNLGIAYSTLGMYAEAVEEFREAVRIDGDRPDYRHNLGLAFQHAGQTDSALAVWRDLLIRWPGYSRTAQAMRSQSGSEGRPLIP